jgi:hypothetical protein
MKTETAKTDHLNNSLANWEMTIEERQASLLRAAYGLGIAHGSATTLRRLLEAEATD